MGRLLAQLGHRVETVYAHGLAAEKDDAKLLGYARANAFVFLSFDEMRGEQGRRVNWQIHNHGGKLIHIAGGPQQPAMRSVGKLLFHWGEWFAFLLAHDGRVDLRDLKHDCKLTPRTELAEPIETISAPHFDDYLAEVEQLKQAAIKRPRRSRSVSDLQGGLYPFESPPRR